MTQVPRKSLYYANLCDKKQKAHGINQIRVIALKNLVTHQQIRWGSNKNVITVLHTLHVKKYINTIIAMALYLKVVYTSGHQK